jgi:hypothetical protein
MDTGDLAVKTIRDGALYKLILSGEPDPAGVTFFDCAGMGALEIAARFAPGGCPVIMQSSSPVVRLIFALLDLDPENFQDLNADLGPAAGLRDDVTTQKEHGPAERQLGP